MRSNAGSIDKEIARAGTLPDYNLCAILIACRQTTKRPGASSFIPTAAAVLCVSLSCALPKSDSVDTVQVLDLLQRYGLALGMPHAKPIAGMWNCVPAEAASSTCCGNWPPLHPPARLSQTESSRARWREIFKPRSGAGLTFLTKEKE